MVSALMPLPVTPYAAIHKQRSRVSSQALVPYRTNDYSLPTQYGHQVVLVKGTIDWVNIYLVGKPETFGIGPVDHSIGQAHDLGVLRFDAIKHLIMLATTSVCSGSRTGEASRIRDSV